MITTTIETPDNPYFPKIMVSKTSGVVVGFASPKCGVVLRNDSTLEPPLYPHRVFDYYEMWDMSNFVDFNFKITLRNS